jgi:transposase
MSIVALKAKSETLAARVERAAQMVYLDGATEVQISKSFKISQVTVRDWKRRSEWGDAIVKLREHQQKVVLDRLALLTERAADAVEECLNSENDAVKLKAATWVLERGEALQSENNRSTGLGEVEQFMKMVTGHDSQ